MPFIKPINRAEMLDIRQQAFHFTQPSTPHFRRVMQELEWQAQASFDLLQRQLAEASTESRPRKKASGLGIYAR